MKQYGFFDEKDWLKEVSKPDVPSRTLQCLRQLGIIQENANADIVKETQRVRGRFSFDYMMMYKILILWRLYNISNVQAKILDTVFYDFTQYLEEKKTITYIRIL